MNDLEYEIYKTKCKLRETKHNSKLKAKYKAELKLLKNAHETNRKRMGE